jgi:hypothetical protein
MKRLFTICLLLIFILSGCIDETETSLLDGPWAINSKGNITLYTRPPGYSSMASPETSEITQTLDNQIMFIELVNQKLDVNFNSGVSIYFFNLDEAESKLGVKGGGSSNSERKEIYYSFYLNQYYPSYQVYDYLGVHEMVHIVSGNTIGLPGTLMMAEGYAVAIDGTLSSTDSSGKTRKTIDAWMVEFRAQNKLLTPTQLLMDFESLPKEQSYAQSGYFINWLFSKYGVAKINQLFTSKGENFKVDLHKVTGVPFAEMETEYMNNFK